MYEPKGEKEETVKAPNGDDIVLKCNGVVCPRQSTRRARWCAAWSSMSYACSTRCAVERSSLQLAARPSLLQGANGSCCASWTRRLGRVGVLALTKHTVLSTTCAAQRRSADYVDRRQVGDEDEQRGHHDRHP